MDSILLFSRGRGFGHAARDIVLLDMCKQEIGDYNFICASYSSGYQYFQSRGISCCELGMGTPQSKVLRQAHIISLIDQIKPKLIISDEEFDVIPVAIAFDIRTLLITNWVPPTMNSPESEAFRLADCLMFLDLRGSCPIPQYLSKTKFVGPIIRSSKISRPKARIELGIDCNMSIATISGGFILDLDLAYLDRTIQLCLESGLFDKVFVLAGRLSKYLSFYCDERVHVIDSEEAPDIYYCASDLVFSRGGHSTLWELAKSTIPCLITPRPLSENPINTLVAKRMSKYPGISILKDNDTVDCFKLKVYQVLSEREELKLLAADGFGEVDTDPISLIKNLLGMVS